VESLLKRPEYIHAAINHLPLVGLLAAMIVLVAALFLKHRPTLFFALGMVAVFALSVWPVYEFGEQGFDRVLTMADDPGQAFLRLHAQMAARWCFLYYVTAAMAAIGIGLTWKWPQLGAPLAILTLLVAAASLVAGICIAQAGGEVRHREFRFRPPPAETQSH
jgi:hypothetical protein